MLVSLDCRSATVASIARGLLWTACYVVSCVQEFSSCGNRIITQLLQQSVAAASGITAVTHRKQRLCAVQVEDVAADC